MPSSQVFHNWKAGKLHSGSKSGPIVKSHDQAIAIYMSEKAKEAAHGGKYPERRAMGGLAPPPPNTLQGLGRPMTPMPMQPPVGQMGAPPMGMGRGYQMGGMPNLGNIFERSEARQLMHTGPILSTVGGRTDQHAISVPSGSYVFPAAHVSALGQGNTINGLKVLQGMFGPSIHQPRGMGIPHARPPAPMNFGKMAGPGLPASMRAEGGRTDAEKMAILQHLRSSQGPSYNEQNPTVLPIIPSGPLAPDKADGGDVISFDSAMARRAQNRPEGQYADEKAKAATRDVLGRALGVNNVLQIGPGDGSSAGGRHGGHVGKPVDIMAAGGEYILGPDQVMRVGGGDLDKGHKILDHWVQKTHKKFAKTVANLPPPAKS